MKTRPFGGTRRTEVGGISVHVAKISPVGENLAPIGLTVLRCYCPSTRFRQKRPAGDESEKEWKFAHLAELAKLTSANNSSIWWEIPLMVKSWPRWISAGGPLQRCFCPSRRFRLKNNQPLETGNQRKFAHFVELAVLILAENSPIWRKPFHLT